MDKDIKSIKALIIFGYKICRGRPYSFSINLLLNSQRYLHLYESIG